MCRDWRARHQQGCGGRSEREACSRSYHRHGERRRADRKEIARRQVKTDLEQEQQHPDARQDVEVRIGAYELQPRETGQASQDHAGKKLPHDGRLAEMNGETSTEQRGRENDGQAQGSYPFIFEQDGEIWMIPESGEARSINLYRAEKFPDKWKYEGCLIDDIDGYDATFLLHGGRFWLFVCEKTWNSTGWDELSLFSSTDLIRGWQPHPKNPILIDASVSRSGGAIFRRGDQIIRPAQDCSHYYGGGISLCRVDALGTDEFSQTIIGSINCVDGCHTYNNNAGLEVIDVFGRTRGLREVTATFARW